MTPRRLRFQKRLKLGFWYSPLLSESRRKTVLPCELTLEEPEAPQERQEDERQHDDDCEPNDVRADSDSDGDEEEQEMEDEDGAVHRPQTRSRTTAYEQLPSEKKQLKKILREELQRQGDFSKCSIRALQDLILDQRGAPDLKKAMSAGSMLNEADPEATASSRGGSAALSAAAPPSQLHTAKQRRRRERLERILSFAKETVETDLSLGDSSTTTKLRAACRIANGFIQRQHRERTGEGRHRFMEQDFLDADLVATQAAVTQAQRDLEKSLRRRVGWTFRIGDEEPAVTWRLRADEGECERAFNFSSEEEDFRIFYYNFDVHGCQDPGDGQHIEFSFWSSIRDRVQWDQDPEPLGSLI